MATGSFYIIENNVVVNNAIFNEEDAVKLGLKRSPITTEFGTVTMGWTYLPNEDRFLPPPRDILAEWQDFENHRNALYQELRYYISPINWATYTAEEKDKWREYREKLINLREGVLDPRDIVWPNKPYVEQMDNIVPSIPEV